MSGNITVKGKYSYLISPASNTVTLSVDEIDSNITSGSTGTLRLELWLTTTPWNFAGSNSGYEVGTYQITGSSKGTLGPNQYFSNVSGTAPYSIHPPSGVYYVTFAIAEYTNTSPSVDNGFVIDTANTFDQLAYVNSSGGYQSIYQPTISVQNKIIPVGNSISASSLISAVTDKNNFPISYYDFRDNTVGGGYFTLNGVKQAEGSWIQVSASDLSKLQYVASNNKTVDSIDIAAFDGYVWSAYQTATVTSSLSVSVAQVTLVKENGSATQSLDFTITLSAPSTEVVSVNVDTQNDTAVSGVDYVGVHKTVTFAPGSTSAILSVPIIQNTIFQPTRALEVNLSSPVGAAISSSTSTGLGLIVDSNTPSGVILPTDTYFTLQWYLYDVRAEYAWATSTGKGIKIGVLDQGIDGTNPDLVKNDNLNLGRGALTLSTGGSPVQATDNHGTWVAGVIAAARDGQGIVGVAYDASLISIYSPENLSSNYLTEIANGFEYAKNLDVLNNSWGFGNVLEFGTNWAFLDNANSPEFTKDFAALKDLATNGRNGLGTNVVQSAGNAYSFGDDTNLHNFQNSRYITTVASTDYFGNISSFSTRGASILVSAPGGAGNGNFGSILTTDRTGSGGEFAGNIALEDGTSFSAPIVSGVVALMLQVNPNLGYRDVQQILAYTAHEIDTGDGEWVYNKATNWNGGGLHYNILQTSGFGQVDALAAVRLAASWDTSPNDVANTKEVILSKSVNQLIPDNSPTKGVISNIQVTDKMQVERVDVVINIVHPFIGDLSIWLVSPSGTSSNLLWRPAQGSLSAFGSSQHDIHFTFDTVLDWGEEATGTWTLAVYDNQAGDVGNLVDWTLDLIGKPESSTHTFIYTNEFASIVASNPERGTISDPAGIDDVINAAALGSDDRIDLSGKTPSIIIGANLTISPDTKIKTAIGGAGNDILISSSLGSILKGMDGNDVLQGGTGNDVLQGDGGNDSLDGGGGVDMAIFGGSRSNYLITVNGGSTQVNDTRGIDGTDTLQNIERLNFSDGNIALDLNGAAGIVAKTIGAVFGLAGLSNKTYIGQALSQIDSGTSYEQLLLQALNTVLGANPTSAEIVDLMYTNVIGSHPPPDAKTYYMNLLDSGAFTLGNLALFAADSSYNVAHVNLVGLSQTGLGYILPA